MLMLKVALVVARFASVIRTVKLNELATVGVPLRTPAVFSVIPGGTPLLSPEGTMPKV